MRRSCPCAIELTRAFSNGADEPLHRHLGSCERCAAEWAKLAELRGLARQLPRTIVSVDRTEQLRAGLLAKAEQAPRRNVARRLWCALGAGGVAAAMAVVLVTWSGREATPAPPPPTTVSVPTYRGSVHAHGEAAFVRAGQQPDEIVRLSEGVLTVEVARLADGERFRVITGDAEVEVRGTAFDVVARGDRLVAVRVFGGHVEVRPAKGAAVTLGPGAEWPPLEVPEPTPAAVAAEPKVLPHLPRAVRPAPVPTRAPALAESPGDVAFEEGWTAMRGGDALAAAEAFERAVRAVPTAPIAEDAWFWRAVSLARAGRATEAQTAFAGFVDRYPGSPRAGEASAMLGWLLFDAGDLDGARARFRAAENDRVDEARASARAGLDALVKPRPPR